MDKQPTPSLLPVFRSQQQADLLALLLGDPDLEISLSELANMTGVPYPSVHREINRAEAAGLVSSRKIGNTRLVRADTSSPYYEGLSDVLVRAFGPPTVIADALASLGGIDRTYIFGSWAARRRGIEGRRPVGDLDLLVLGSPDRDQVYIALSGVEDRLGREVQVTFRDSDWLESGDGAFHQTVTTGPMVEIDLRTTRTTRAESNR